MGEGDASGHDGKVSGLQLAQILKATVGVVAD